MPSPSTTRYIRYNLRISDTVYITQGIQRMRVSSSLCSLLTCNLSCLYFLTPFHNFLPLFLFLLPFLSVYIFTFSSPFPLSISASFKNPTSLVFLFTQPNMFSLLLNLIFPLSGDVHGHRQRCDQVFSILRSFLLPLQRSILPRP